MSKESEMVADDQYGQQHSVQLSQQIKTKIREQGGAISFRDYMHTCLYEPGFGYYSAGSHKLGTGGDFTTAPEISPLFGHTLAQHIVDVFNQTVHHHILEFGAGSGKLACDILTRLKQLDSLPERYAIIEVSPDLAARQQALLQQQHPDCYQRIVWLTEIPEDLNGVVLANEVCDAMPVHMLRFEDNHSLKERFIGFNQQEFYWLDKPIADPRLAAIAKSINKQGLTYPYQTEVNLVATDWLFTLTQQLQQGAIFILDYGYSFDEYYQSQRQQGTLRCYYQQQAHDNIFFLPGLQDITTHVNFTALAETAFAQNFQVAGFHEQADFLLAGGISELAADLQQNSTTLDWLQHSAGLKQLLLPGAMGHQFKVLSLTKDLEPLPRLHFADRRYLL